MYRLLIADDEELVRRGLTALIEREAPAITVVGAAVDGLEALELARSCAPDIVLTDIRMPGLDGLDLIGRLREHVPPPHCIILSGYNEFDYARRAVGLGVADYLLKPVDPDELLALLERIGAQIATTRHEQQIHSAAERVLVERAAHRVLNGLGAGADDQLTASFLSSAPAWGLLLIQPAIESDAQGRHAVLGAACRAQLPGTIAVEDAYGYLCLLVPCPDPEPATFAALAETLYQALRAAGWHVALTVARPCATACEISGRYQEALEVADYHDAGAGSSLLRCWDMLRHVARWPAFPTTYRDALLDAIADGSVTDARRAGHDFMVYLEEHASRTARCALWFEMVMLAVHHVQQFGVRADALLDGQQDLRALLRATYDAGSLEERLVSVATRAARECGLLRSESKPRGAIADLRAFIESHLADDLTITALARRVSLNGKYLAELFREATGEPLGKFIIRTRMRHACELLAHSSLKVYEVAEKVGYADPKHFTGMFRTVVGVSPAEYREQHRTAAVTAEEPAISCDD
ncbi:MAG TPA: response regulator transcription factor [Chloroflexota bacterium]|nr:response regulator transcription factor [Chloroflexota bacterium]